MSFILDALRKSDTEHQQQSQKGLTTPQQRAPKAPRNVWVPVVGGLLALNAVVLTLFLATRDQDDPAATAADPVAETNAAPETRSLREEAAGRQAPQPVAETARPEPQRVTAAPQPSPTPTVAAAPVKVAPAAPPPAEPPSSDTIRPSLPSFEQLVLGGVIATPPLHLDMHVFAGERDKRFVFINMNKYREGEALKEGPVLEEITGTGVVLSHQGNRFTLDRN
ncbi:MAG: general secretion pathway protein GspB [Gammaproteobacteria bacterium]